MSIFLIDKIKPIGKFPVYEDRDGYGGFQVRSNQSDRNGIPKLNRKEGMLVYTVQDQVFWQLRGGIENTNWQQVTLGSGGGGGGGGTGITIPPGSDGYVAVAVGASGSETLSFHKILDVNVDDAAAIHGTKINPDFGSQNISTTGEVKANDGYISNLLKFSGTPSVTGPGADYGGIYFDSDDHKFKVTEDGVNYKDLVSDFPLPTPNNQDRVLITRAGPVGGSPNIMWELIGNSLVADNADIDGTKIRPQFGSQNITTDGYFAVQDGYFGGFISLDEAPSVPSEALAKGLIYFDGTKFKVSENQTGWVDLVKSTVFADQTTDGILKLSGDLGGDHNAPKVLKINGASVPETSLTSPRTVGNVLQVSGADSLNYGPLNLEGGDGYISGILPISNGGSPVTYAEFSFNAGVFKTSEGIYESVGALLFAKSKVGPLHSGTKTRKIFLRTLMYTTGGAKGTVILYDYNQGTTIPLQDITVGGSITRQHYMSTESPTPFLLESMDLETLISDSGSTYEIRIKKENGAAEDQAICLMSKLYVEWS